MSFPRKRELNAYYLVHTLLINLFEDKLQYSMNFASLNFAVLYGPWLSRVQLEFKQNKD